MRNILRYVLLVLTVAAVFLAFFVLYGLAGDLLAAAFSGASGVQAAYRRSLFEKVFVIASGIGAIAAIIVCDWYYGKAAGAANLLQRFARTTAVIGFVLAACHAVSWLLGSRSPLTVALAGGELLLGAVLLLLSLVRRRP